MDETTRRMTALDYAMRFNAAVGVFCPGCVITQAKQFDEFLRTGTVENLKHLGATEDDPDDGAVIVEFPKGRPN